MRRPIKANISTNMGLQISLPQSDGTNWYIYEHVEMQKFELQIGFKGKNTDFLFPNLSETVDAVVYIQENNDISVYKENLKPSIL